MTSIAISLLSAKLLKLIYYIYIFKIKNKKSYLEFKEMIITHTKYEFNNMLDQSRLFFLKRKANIIQ